MKKLSDITKVKNTKLITETMKKKIERGLLKELPRGLNITKQVLLLEDGTILLYNPKNKMCISESKVYEVNPDKLFNSVKGIYDVNNYCLELFIQKEID